jgi:hypothetical protein
VDQEQWTGFRVAFVGGGQSQSPHRGAHFGLKLNAENLSEDGIEEPVEALWKLGNPFPDALQAPPVIEGSQQRAQNYPSP